MSNNDLVVRILERSERNLPGLVDEVVSIIDERSTDLERIERTLERLSESAILGIGEVPYLALVGYAFSVDEDLARTYLELVTNEY